MLKECRKDRDNVDLIEKVKMDTWDELAQRYLEEEVIANIPTMIEAVYFHEFDWLSKIKNLDANMNRMIFLAVEDGVKPKVSRIVTDEYFDILSKHVYRALKESL